MTRERNSLPLWIVVLIGASLAAGWTSIPFLVEWASSIFHG